MSFTPRRPIPLESRRIALDREIKLKFRDFEGFVGQFASNLSMTGMFVQSDEPQPPGTPVSFEFRLEDGMELIEGKGWVVWSREKPLSSRLPAGMGIEFLELGGKSRRLIRWLVTNELPDGLRPFDVEDGRGLGSARPERRGRLFLVPGIAVGLGAFLLLAALAWWGPGRWPRSGETARTVGAGAAISPTGGVAEIEDAGSGDRLIEVPHAVAARTAELERVVRDWAAAWSRQDIGAYLGFYASEFEPEGGLGREEWRLERRRRLERPGQIRIAVSELEVLESTPHRATARFVQTYRSDTYADKVEKTLTLVRAGGAWKIEREIARPIGS